MVNSLSVETLLKKEGPCLSTRLCEILQRAGVSPEAARQRISRANGSIMRLAGLVFPQGARFIYNKSDFGSVSYWTSLLRDIDKASPAYSAAIAALKARGGIVPRSHFEIISGAPILQKGQISSETVLERLLAVKLVQLVEVDGIGSCVRLDAGGYLGEVSKNDFKARLITEKILLLAVKDWARKLGVASYEKICMRDDPGPSPRVGTFAWDLTGPSYLKPMARWVKGKPKPGFLICDVVLGDQIDEDAVASIDTHK